MFSLFRILDVLSEFDFILTLTTTCLLVIQIRDFEKGHEQFESRMHGFES